VRRSIWMVALLLLLPGLAAAQPQGDTRLLRYPDICGDTIAFVYGGDLWLAGAGGGVARRLTSGEGEELGPKFSPDCKSIAFTGQYTGTRQVYVIPVDGGTPRQLTFHNDVGTIPPRGGFDNQVLGWTPDGRQILFNAHRTPYSERNARPHLISAAGGMETPLAIREGSAGVLSPDGDSFVFAPVMDEFRNWKRYRGGRAADLWIYHLKKNTAERITDSPSNDYMPVWIGDTIYFVSDRDKVGSTYVNNLFAYDTKSKAVRRVTNHDTFDVFWPSSGDRRRIVYEDGGSIYLFDPATGKSGRVPIRVEGDLPRTLPYFKNVAENIDAITLSPTGKRALFTARGEVFSVPAEKGEIRNLTQSQGVREVSATWSPDGRWIAYLSDRSGEYEVWLRPADGSGEERRVTTDGDIWRFPLSWSPDSKKLAFGDKNRRLRWVDVASGKVTDADRDRRNDIQDYKWSPDSRYLAYTKVGENQFPSIWIYSLDDGKARQLTSDLTAEGEPTWDPKGHYLYFLSNRDFNLTFSGYEFDYVYTNPTRVYVGLLSKEGPALLLPESDEETPKPEEKPASTEAKTEAKAAAQKVADDAAGDKPDRAPKPGVRVKIDFDGFDQRVRALPAPPGNYQGLSASADAVFYLRGGAGGGGGGPQSLRMFSFKDRKEDAVMDGVGGYDLSADGKKIIYRQRDTYGIIDARPGQKPGDGKLDLESMTVRIQPRDEWRQEFVDAWRIFRDWFYDPNLHGADWKGLRERYGEMIPYMSDRSDLNYLLAELSGEVSVGHGYVEPAEGSEGPKRVEGALLGAEIVADPSGYYRVAHIFPGENWQKDFRSPLTEPGVHVETGDYILAVDGKTTKGVDNFYRLMEGKAERVLTLLVNGKPNSQGAHEERVRPVSTEQNLRYLDWVQANRAKVDKLSGGRIGYLHLPDTAVAGNRELFKYFYPLADKDAEIFDDRYNQGGFIPDRMIALISRPLLNYFVGRAGVANPTPQFVSTGPKVALINGQAGSGGDAFPYYFREMKLGPLIGTRTWGGLAGLSGNPPLVDGGTLTVPTFRILTTEGKWAVENEGVSPDIEVIDAPDALARGEDPSLERGVRHLLDQLQKNPPRKVVVPPVPVGGAPH
jgi:tricorn protease